MSAFPKPSDFVSLYVSGYPRIFWKDRIMLMLQGVFDDSGSSNKEPVFVLAGCIAEARCWMDFADDWSSALNKEPSITYLKMSEAMALTGQFRGWRPDARDLKIYILAEVLSKYPEAYVASWVKRSDFLDFVYCHSYGDKQSTYFTPYFMLFHRCVAAVNVHAKIKEQEGRDVSIGYFFDEQGIEGAKALKFWDDLKEVVEKEKSALMGTRPVFEDEKRFLPLQAADMFAWCVRDYHVKGVNTSSALLRSAVLRLMSKTTGLYVRGYTREETIAYGMNLIVGTAREDGLLGSTRTVTN